MVNKTPPASQTPS
ncbi:unnamed protein product, partial [Rotaria magnacalcarata]